jgi:NhaA family Na+:H+ antiporter
MHVAPRHPVLAYVIDHSLLLVAGTAIALIWANVDLEGYQHFAHLTHFAVNDIGMVFFFALAAKEIFEATLPGGSLASPRQAAVPIMAAVGGMVLPALMYTAIVTAAGRPDLVRGWAIPCATDIAFSYLTARLIFGLRHPAIPFLLLLAIADDALGLMILALFYPTREVSLLQFALFMVPALLAGWALRRVKTTSFWPYVIAGGGLSWLALFRGGFHPALALVPIVPFMPHARRDRGMFHPEESAAGDTMNRFEHWWQVPVQIILFFFGLANAGVPLASVGLATWAVLIALVAGKPMGVALFTVGARAFGFERPQGLRLDDVVVTGLIAGIGFTVSLFFATAAFPAGRSLDEAKMGALSSFVAAPLAYLIGRVLANRSGGPRSERVMPG